MENSWCTRNGVIHHARGGKRVLMVFNCRTIDHYASSRRRSFVPVRATFDGQSLYPTSQRWLTMGFTYHVFIDLAFSYHLCSPEQISRAFRNLMIQRALYSTFQLSRDAKHNHHKSKKQEARVIGTVHDCFWHQPYKQAPFFGCRSSSPYTGTPDLRHAKQQTDPPLPPPQPVTYVLFQARLLRGLMPEPQTENCRFGRAGLDCSESWVTTIRTCKVLHRNTRSIIICRVLLFSSAAYSYCPCDTYLIHTRRGTMCTIYALRNNR